MHLKDWICQTTQSDLVVIRRYLFWQVLFADLGLQKSGKRDLFWHIAATLVYLQLINVDLISAKENREARFGNRGKKAALRHPITVLPNYDVKASNYLNIRLKYRIT